MKTYFLFLTLIMTALTAISQTGLDSAVNKVVAKQIQSYDSTLPKVVTITARTIGAQTVNVDTILFPGYRTALVSATAQAQSVTTSDAAMGQKSYALKCINGTYSFIYQKNNDGAGFAGSGNVAKASWSMIVNGNNPTLQITGTVGQTIDWYVTYTVTLQK